MAKSNAQRQREYRARQKAARAVEQQAAAAAATAATVAVALGELPEPPTAEQRRAIVGAKLTALAADKRAAVRDLTDAARYLDSTDDDEDRADDTRADDGPR